MTGESPTAPSPADGGPRIASRTRRSSVAPLAAVAVAIVAIGGAYLTSHKGKRRVPRSSATVASLSPTYPTPALAGALHSELGPDGMTWQWIGRVASFELTGVKQSWVVFRALSRPQRKLVFSESAGEHVSVNIQASPEVYLVGPLSPGRVALNAARTSAARREKGSARSVFMSTLRAASNPVAVLPGTGFWSTESSGGVVFNWMRSSGAIDVYAPGSPGGQVWLTFLARSLGEPRALTIRGGAGSHHVAVTTTAEPVTVGPFTLANGRARVTLTASPGPAQYGADPRALSVQVASLGGYTVAAKA
jgi:hypothetical protein